MKTALKNFIFNGLSYGLLFFALSFVAGYITFHLPLNKALIIAALMGIITLVINGLLQGRFTKSSRTLYAITISLQDGEVVSIAAPANHIIHDHLVSGKLFLTEKSLIFKPLKEMELTWFLDEFVSFQFYPSIFNAGGEFIIHLKKQHRLIFEVDEIRKWKKAFKNLHHNTV